MKSPNARITPNSWTLRYPPVVAMALLLVLVLAILPSALNVPQSNPNTVPEFAPVPRDEDNVGPPGGNLSSLGLASGRFGITNEDTQSVDVVRRGRGAGKNPSVKRCVGNPPRQTEDLLSPPCVAAFNGDNGGSTAPGVTGEEVKMLLYIYDASSGFETGACNRYYDPFEPPDDAPLTSAVLRIVRDYERYFNDRFQTFGRQVRTTVFVSCGYTPEERRAEADDNVATAKPFTVINAQYGNTADYLEIMASRGVVSFGTFDLESRTFYNRHPNMIWNLDPTIELVSSHYVNYLCSQVIPYPVSFGEEQWIGDKRVLGLLKTEDSLYPQQRLINQLVTEGVEECGGSIKLDAAYPIRRDPTRAAQNMAAFQGADVSTIIWTGVPGDYGYHSQSAAAIGYTPEIVLLSQPAFEWARNSDAQSEDQTVWKNSWVVTYRTLYGLQRDEPCVQAIYEVDPSFPDAIGIGLACETIYPRMFQAFVGIQVAGPRLSSRSVGQGLRAIPPLESTNPRVPACFYPPGEHTCIRDAVAMWWDPNGDSVNYEEPGCWKMTKGGKRYLEGKWPKGDLLEQKNIGQDFCNNL